MDDKGSNKAQKINSPINGLELSSSEFESAALNNSSDGITAINLKGEILFWNDGAVKLSGYSEEEVLGKNISIVYRKQDIPDLVERIKKAKQGEFFTNKELIMIDKEGKEHQVLLTLNGLTDSAGNITTLLGVTKDITDLKRAELELKRAQEIAHIGNWYLDLSTGEITWSDELYKMYGFDPALPIPPLTEHEKFLTPESWELLNTSIEHTRKTGEPYAIELKINNELGDDVWQWFYAKGEAVFDSKNTIIALRGTAQDITDRKIAEERVKESEASIKTILNSLQASVCVIDGTGKILQVNNSWEEFGKLNGMPRGTDYYKEYNYFDVCKKDLQNEDARFALRGLLSLAENKITEFEHEYPCHSPKRKQWFSLRAKLMKSKDIQIVISHIDITSRKLAEENIKETLTQLNVAVDTAKIGVWTQNVETGELTWNSELFSIFGLETSEFDYSIESFLKTVHPEDIDYLTDLQEKLMQKKTIPDFNYRIFRPSGEVRYIQASATPILDDKQNLIKIVGIKLDKTEERKAEEKLEKANEELMHAVSTLNELRQQIEAENIYLKEELRLDGSFNEIVGSSPPLRKMLRQVQQVAKTDSTVLILGETGTGKELIARAIHDSSNRKDKPMVKVNCSALPAELIESEFFGHEAGAFTSAIARKIGRFELANGGTIFLDEIGDLPIGLQTRLLRVLQENEFERVGGEETIKIDVRVITATNRNLEQEVINGNFRQDLYYRLNVFPITCPPLRKRMDDIPDLVNHFVNKYNQKLKKNITAVSQKTIDNLIKYKWPGNIRELEHVIERSVIVNQGSQLRIGAWFSNSDIGNVVPDDLTTLEDVERNYITKVLDEVNWKIRGKNGAAEILGLKPTTLESRMKKWNISRKK
ncbi:MAG: sigma 54-interacting transcriptional regulator [Bacteroidia bacterium]|nr:sigma 54-interacting transcriptional regulator [Bacteroidia bacterium]NNK28968.1 sigma 54-interacting transcriptional regulator [Flavobacteriaceae bacterium]